MLHNYFVKYIFVLYALGNHIFYYQIETHIWQLTNQSKFVWCHDRVSSKRRERAYYPNYLLCQRSTTRAFHNVRKYLFKKDKLFVWPDIRVKDAGKFKWRSLPFSKFSKRKTWREIAKTYYHYNLVPRGLVYILMYLIIRVAKYPIFLLVEEHTVIKRTPQE